MTENGLEGLDRCEAAGQAVIGRELRVIGEPWRLGPHGTVARSTTARF